VKLRVLFWKGERPEPGDELRTGTGRRYLILGWTERQIIALVLPKNEPAKGKVFRWEWASRKKT
jgi:hypothetical protein